MRIEFESILTAVFGHRGFPRSHLQTVSLQFSSQRIKALNVVLFDWQSLVIIIGGRMQFIPIGPHSGETLIRLMMKGAN